MEEEASSAAAANPASTASEDNKRVKLVIQQCLLARLVLPSEETASIGRGMVVFVCFLKGAEKEETAIRAAEVVAKLKLCEAEADGDGNKRRSVTDVSGDVLIVPQATLGGKLKKGKSIQYHSNVDKTKGQALYDAFCSAMRGLCSGAKVESGVYGARQVLSMETNGPYTHVFEF